EDPLTWFNNFEKAKNANQWKDDRRVAIAGGYLKGLAAEWFSDIKTTIGNNWVHGSGTGNVQNFEDQFKLRFVTEQRKNKWFDELMQIKQNNDSVEKYAATFVKLAKRCGFDDDAQKKRLFLFGLSPNLIPFVQMQNHATLSDMINNAKQIESGFNLARGIKPQPSTSSTTMDQTVSTPAFNNINPIVPPVQPPEKSEIDKLTDQLQQLSLN